MMCSNQVWVGVRKRKTIGLRLSGVNGIQTLYLHLEVKSWPFEIGNIYSEVFFPDNLGFSKEKGIKKHFFSPECSSVGSQGLDLNQWPGQY